MRRALAWLCLAHMAGPARPETSAAPLSVREVQECMRDTDLLVLGNSVSRHWHEVFRTIMNVTDAAALDGSLEALAGSAAAVPACEADRDRQREKARCPKTMSADC